MPQISIEYSGNAGAIFEPESFASRVHEHVVSIAKAELRSCKTRLIEHRTVIGDGSHRNAMIHVDIRLLRGRSDEQKQRLGKAVPATLEEMVPPGDVDLQLTVEVRELDSGNYHKRHFAA